MKLPINYDDISQYERKLVREEYARRQNNNCYYCGKDLDIRPKQTKPLNSSLFPDGFLVHPVHLHHNHDTGMTIGAVHSYCNGVLWQYHGE